MTIHLTGRNVRWGGNGRCLHLLIMGVMTAVGLLTLFTALTTQAAPQNANWHFTPVAQEGQDGFSFLSPSKANNAGDVLMYGMQNGVSGLHLYTGGVITNVVSIGSALPDDLGVVQQLDPLAGLDHQGRVIFKAHVQGGQLSDGPHIFRWQNGAITHLLAVFCDPNMGCDTHRIENLNSQGQWLIERVVATPLTRQIFLTDGSATTLLMQIPIDTTCPDTSDAIDFFFNSSGQAGYTEAASTLDCNNGTTLESRSSLWQAAPETLLLAQLVTPNPVVNPREYFASGSRMNNAGDIVVRQWREDPLAGFQVVRRRIQRISASGMTTLADSQDFSPPHPESVSLEIAGWSESAQVVYLISLRKIDFTYDYFLMDGPDPAADIILRNGDMLFGSEVGSLSVQPFSANQQNAFPFFYFLQNGERGIALATPPVSRWINPAGGAWNSAANWSPVGVPGQGNATLFDLDNVYTVDLPDTADEHQVGRLEQTHGSLTLDISGTAGNSPNLDILGTLQVGNDALLDVQEGFLRVGDTAVGHLPPTNPAEPDTAQLLVVNSGVFSNTGTIEIGAAAPGCLTVSSGGSMDAAQILVGVHDTGCLIVRDDGSSLAAQALHVGHSYTGTMALENGAAVTVQSFALHHTETITDVGEAWSRVTLDQEGPGANPSSLTVLDSAVIGWRNIGQLGILNGASANVGDDLFLSGVGGFGEIYLHDASSLLVNGDLITAWEGNSAAKLAATSDSQVQILGNLEASSGAGSSLFYVTEPGTRLEVDGICYLGAGELSTVQMRIAAGGVFDCGQATYVGYQNQAYTAWVTVGAGNGGPGRLQGMRLWVGQDTLGGAPADLLIGAVGLEGGEIEMAVSVYVDAHGAITGTGTIAPGFGIVVANGGYLAPGLDPDQPPARLARQTAAEGAPGTLTIAGALTLSDTARLALDLFGPTAAEQDRLVVSDTAVFNGILALNFTNGYAPRQGDVLTFVTVSGAASGSFADVTISGLEPGFAFDVDVSGGAVTLTALNDGVPTTGGQYRLYLPLARQP